MPSPDPWTAFLDWLVSIIVPPWGSLIAMLPLFLILGLVGPLLTLLALMWAWHLWHQRKGRVWLAEPEAVPAETGPDGRPVFPPNVPYCERHAVLYPASRRTCEVDGENLLVGCPVDGTVRPAAIETCSACGTRFVLGAGTGPQLVRSSGRPPEGGAAVA